ncbi:MAG: hypothetical protein SRB2_02105 [Desulfobacteraceae bacterium Eth-SRB2]|nr:MAG: hypothetical protein SRB2_02105 [Desulfobacteraceae bacterium Eth-SRB2]
MDQDYKRLFGRRQPNDLNNVLKVLEPFKADLEGVIVESTYNWYWLVDGLQEHGYKSPIRFKAIVFRPCLMHNA